MTRRWMVLGGYAAAIYATLPYGPALGRIVLRSPLGSWLLGSGMAVLAVAIGATVAVVLRRRGAPASAYGALLLAGVGTTLGLAWLKWQHLERIHLPEYAIAAWLAWRALAPHVGSRARAYAGATAIAAALGVVDELLQAVTPGRVCDVRDMLANALGAVLGMLVLVAFRWADAPESRAAAPLARSERAAVSGGS